MTMTPTKRINQFLVMCVIAGLAACGSSDPASMTRQIDELLAKDLPMTAEQQAEFADANDKGRALLAAGDVDESAKHLERALEVLEQASDAAMFNKSE